MSVNYCKNCIYPSTKPDLEFNLEGLCQGCVAYNARKFINWKKRDLEFKKLLSEGKKKNNSIYHCCIPVSGGKDSIYQVAKVLDVGFNPLCVTATTDKFTELGKKNLEVLKNLGVDHVQISTDPILRRKINKFTLKTVGDISWTEHKTIYSIPTRVAQMHKIPFVIWGENANNQSGGPASDEKNFKLTSSWHDEFGGLLGLRVKDLVHSLNTEEEKIFFYKHPSDKELKESNTQGIFLGYFYPWDNVSNLEVAKKYGFQTYDKDEIEGSIVNYENLDNAQMRIHDYFKYLKYGYDRVTDWCCWHIRRGRLTREEAIKINNEKSGKYPSVYLGYSLKEILKEIDCSVNEFNEICDEFTNTEIFMCNNDGKIIKKDDGSLMLKQPYE